MTFPPIVIPVVAIGVTLPESKKLPLIVFTPVRIGVQDPESVRWWCVVGVTVCVAPV